MTPRPRNASFMLCAFPAQPLLARAARGSLEDERVPSVVDRPRFEPAEETLAEQQRTLCRRDAGGDVAQLDVADLEHTDSEPARRHLVAIRQHIGLGPQK